MYIYINIQVFYKVDYDVKVTRLRKQACLTILVIANASIALVTLEEWSGLPKLIDDLQLPSG